MKNCFFVFLAFLSFSTKSFCQEGTDDGRYHSKDYHFSAIKPGGWQMVESYMKSIPVAFLSPSESDADSFHENINVVVEEIGNMKIDEYYDENVKMMTTGLKDFKLEDHGSASVNGLSCKTMIYSHNYNGTALKVLDFIYVTHGNGYVVTCTATPETFDQFESVFRLVAGSFKYD